MDAIILKLSKRLSYRSCAPYTWHKLEDVARGYIIAVCMCDRSSRSRSSSISPVSFRWCHGFGQCKKKKKEDEENGRRVQKERGRRKKRRRRGGRRRAKEKEHYGVRGDSIAITLTHVECRTCRVGNYNSTSRSRGLMHFGREGRQKSDGFFTGTIVDR